MQKEILENVLEQKNGYYELHILEDQLDDLLLVLRLDKPLLNNLFEKAWILHFNKYQNAQRVIHSESPFQNFIFRGQSKSEWGLVPNLFRQYENQWVRKEVETLNDFLAIADLCNIQIPTDSVLLRQRLHNIIQETHPLNRNNWVDSSYYELIGYAQHYDLPTRFLDWSYHPIVALYFASSGYLKNKSIDEILVENKDHFTLWILNTNLIPSKEIELIDIPKSLNQRIALQKGCFTNVRQFPSENTPKNKLLHKYKSPQSVFREDFIFLPEILSQHDLDYTLIKINIPNQLAVPVFKYCNHMGYNAATLFKDMKAYLEEYQILKK